MGRAGRRAISEGLAALKQRLGVDFTIVNSENASGGMGLTGSHAKLILESGVDCITLGDHAFDQKDMLSFIEQEPRIVRPLNFSKVAPGRGARMRFLASFTRTNAMKFWKSRRVGIGLRRTGKWAGSLRPA